MALAGDWHGQTAWARDRIHDVATRGVTTLLHLGDFGIWPGPSGASFLRKVNRYCSEDNLEILVTPGNHENWSRLRTLWENPKRRDPETGDPLPVHLEEHITVLPRGYAWEMHGRRFLSLGGAPSIDFPERTEGRSWWPEEMIQPEDVDRAIRNGLHVDVMLAHDSPGPPYQTPKVASARSTGGSRWTEVGLAWAAVGQERMHQAFMGVAPRLFVHGHYHCSDQTTVQVAGVDHPTRIWSLDCDGAAGNLRYLDLDTLTDPEGWR